MNPVKRRMRMKVRATPEQGSGTFEALVSAYNIEYDVGWGWTEKILSGCFTDSIGEHPTIPIFYEHAWGLGPMGDGKPTETDTGCTVVGQLYLGMGDQVDRVYRGMVAGALEEWSVAFWPLTIIEDSENRYCDQIAKGDLAEASVCVRGANPGTETIDLRSQPVWIDGDVEARKGEVVRLRTMFKVPELRRRDPSKRAAGDEDEPTPGELAQSADSLIDQATELLEAGDTQGVTDILVAADSTVDDLLEALGVPDDDDIEATEDSAGGETDKEAVGRARALEAWTSPGGWELIRALRSSRPAPSAA